MRNKFLFMATLLLVSLFVIGMGGKPVFLESGSDPIDFTLRDLRGESVQLSSYYGKKAVLLNFFNTECPACQVELPELQKLYERYNNKGLEIISVDLKESKETVQAMAKEKGLKFRILLDETGSIGRKYSIRYIPSNYLIDKKGKIFYKTLFTTADELEKVITEVLK